MRTVCKYLCYSVGVEGFLLVQEERYINIFISAKGHIVLGVEGVLHVVEDFFMKNLL